MQRPPPRVTRKASSAASDVYKRQQQPNPAEPNKVVTSDIIKVPSAEEMKKGAKIEVIKKEDLPAEIEKAKEQSKEKADDKE